MTPVTINEVCSVCIQRVTKSMVREHAAKHRMWEPCQRLDRGGEEMSSNIQGNHVIPVLHFFLHVCNFLHFYTLLMFVLLFYKPSDMSVFQEWNTFFFCDSHLLEQHFLAPDCS